MNDMFMENAVFPLPFEIHLIFVCVAIILFIFRFATQRRTYQLLMGSAIAASLLLYVNTGRTWFMCVGVIELVLIVGAIVSSIMDSRKRKAKKAAEAENEEVAAQE